MDNPQALVEAVKAVKQASLRAGEPGMRTLALGELGGSVLATAMAPDCDKRKGLFACRVFRTALGADRVTLVADANGLVMDKDNAAKQNFPPPGSLQKRQEAGDPGVVELLMIVSADQCGVSFKQFPYRVEDGVAVWIEDAAIAGAGWVEIGGSIPDSLRQIMATDPLLEKAVRMAGEADVPVPESVEDQRACVARAGLAALRIKGFAVETPD